jgi:broad specificity phosphatase PhoE
VALLLTVVRHGRTAWNQTGRFQGHTDIPLDEEGRAQARRLAARLGDERFDAAFSSDLARARETAETILGARAATLVLDARWREMRFGEWEGLTWAEIVARSPGIEAGGGAKPRFYTPQGGEGFDAVCARVESALADLTREPARSGNVLIVTHAGPLHALLRVALGDERSDALAVRFSPASVTRLRRSDAAWELAALNVSDEVATTEYPDARK